MRTTLNQWMRELGMIPVLGLLCLLFSVITYSEQYPGGADAAVQLARNIEREFGGQGTVLITALENKQDAAFVDQLQTDLKAAGFEILGVVQGQPSDARRALSDLAQAGRKLDVIAGNQATAGWLVFSELPTDFPALGSPRVMQPKSYHWPNFLKTENLLNIANQIAVIAIVAIGMTMVIITGGIDLSVGSLIAFSAVVTGWFIRDVFGALEASLVGMLAAAVISVLVCGSVGLFSGGMITVFRVPPFIVTLAMMLIASGLAYMVADGQSIYQIPESFIWLGRGADLFGLPNAVVLMIVLYALAYVLMTRTKLGRYIYAVGGNAEAARLSGVPVKWVLLFAYACSGLLAGLGGVILASQLKSGSPTYGQMYELYVIAAVVVGGTSLAGGEGRMQGTFIGALIIAVIWNGMNLTGVDPFAQKVVLGGVILGAVMLDNLKKGDTTLSWKFFRKR